MVFSSHVCFVRTNLWNILPSYWAWGHQLCCVEVRLVHSFELYLTTYRIHVLARTNQLSREKRHSIINLRIKGQSVLKTAKTLNVSPSVAAKTIERDDEIGPHEDRTRVTSAVEVKFIWATSLRYCKLKAPQIRAQTNATQSSNTHRHISTSTVQKRLRKPGLCGEIAAEKTTSKEMQQAEEMLWPRRTRNGH